MGPELSRAPISLGLSTFSEFFLLVDFFLRGGFTKRGGGADASIGPRALETLATPLVQSEKCVCGGGEMILCPPPHTHTHTRTHFWKWGGHGPCRPTLSYAPLFYNRWQLRGDMERDGDRKIERQSEREKERERREGEEGGRERRNWRATYGSQL